MASKNRTHSKDYFGLGRLISLVLVIIPFTSWLLGAIVRIYEGKLVAGIIRIIGIGIILWIFDIISMILTNKIIRILNI